MSKTYGERLVPQSLAISYEDMHTHAREGDRSRVGCFLFCDASMVMTLGGQTFQSIFRSEVSEDLLDNTERIIVDELVGTRIQNTAQFDLIIPRAQHLTSDRKWNNALFAFCLESQFI